MTDTVELSPGQARVLAGVDDQWRYALEVARRAGHDRWLVPAALKKLRDLGLVEAVRDEERGPLRYRRSR